MATNDTLREVRQTLCRERNDKRAVLSARYFKTGAGEYGEGDIFLGLSVPQVRSVVKRYWNKLDLADVERLLNSEWHEFRLAALLMLVAKYEHDGDAKVHKAIFTLYTRNYRCINNWNLVDTSAPQIAGAYISDHMEHEERRAFINRYCRSKDLWQNRIITLATFYQIKNGNVSMSLYVARKLLHHPHDLIHKAVGWMLREVGKRDKKALMGFLKDHTQEMPRTMLRYALERCSPKERSFYMKKKPMVQ